MPCPHLRIPVVLATLALAACASNTPTAARAGAATCNAQAVAWAIGKSATQDTMARVWRESGAGLIRPIAPNQAVRRDIRSDRISVHIDAGNVVTAVACE